MNTTRASLLLRIRDPRDTAAWAQFHDLYAPLLYRYARARGLSREDAEDVRATCYQTIVTKIKEFDYNKAKGGFKAWLRTLVRCRVIDLLRKRREVLIDFTAGDGRATYCELADETPGPDEVWEKHWKYQHLKYCVEQVRKEVSAAQFQAFELLVLKERSVEEVCEELGLSANQVYRAKSRVLRRVRQKLSEMGYEGEF